MDIKETFLKLTEFTIPHGREDSLEHLLPDGFTKDEFGNYFIKVGESETMFTCHLDTYSSKYKKVNHVIDGDFIKTDGSTILGGDDKSGMTVLLYMIWNNIPGLYYFFIGEEVGGIGSSKLARSQDFSKYKRCVSFDRSGYNSIITDQSYGRCCSDEFAKDLADRLNQRNVLFGFYPDSTGSFTDSASFMDKIPECTNISTGYFDYHTVNECQDILFLTNLCEAVILVEWENLPVVRVLNQIFYVNRKSIRSQINYLRENKDDPKADSMSVPIILMVDNKKWLVKLTNSRIIEERSFIYNWVFSQSYFQDIRGVVWDGQTCHIECGSSNEYLGEREEMIHVISELDNVPKHSINFIKKITLKSNQVS